MEPVKGCYQAAPANAPVVSASATVDVDPPTELLLTSYRKSVTIGTDSADASYGTAGMEPEKAPAYIHKTSLGATLITPQAERTGSPPAATPPHLVIPRHTPYLVTPLEQERRDRRVNARRLREAKVSLSSELESLQTGETPQEAAQFYHDRLNTGAVSDPLERSVMQQRSDGHRRSLSFSRNRGGAIKFRDFDEKRENEWRVERKRFCCFHWTLSG